MSAKTLANVARVARDTLIDVAWRQWAALGGPASAEPARSIVDPEALLLLSLSLKNDERRLWDVLASWAQHWSRVLSVQRTRNLAKQYDASVGVALGEFASFAVTEASDARWKPLSDNSVPVRPRKPLSKPPGLNEDAALILRLRLGLGVGLRPDVLSFLMTAPGGPYTVRSVSTALAYTEPATRRVLDDMVSAGLATASFNERPVRYAIEDKSWNSLLRLSRPLPAWRYWQQVFPLLARVVTWHTSSGNRTVSQFALDSLGWEIIEQHLAGFRLNDIPIRLDPQHRPSFAEAMRVLCDWVETHV